MPVMHHSPVPFGMPEFDAVQKSLNRRFGNAAFFDRTPWVGYGRNKATDDQQKENYRLVHQSLDF